MQIVFVKWVDASTHDHWDALECMESSPLKVCYASGFLITDNKVKTSVALLFEGGAGASWIDIPTQNVLEIKVLGELGAEGELRYAKD